MVAAVVLAAGASTRMGAANKLLADVEGEPLIRRTVRALHGLPFALRIIVTGHDAEGVRAALDGLDLRFVHNTDHAEGIASSIRTGIAALPSGVAAALIVPGDMPWIAPSDIAALLEAFDAAGGEGGVFVPVRGGRRGNPVLWAARHFEALLRLEGDTGGRQLFARLSGELREVTVAGDGVLLDVDRPNDLAPPPLGSGLSF